MSQHPDCGHTGQEHEEMPVMSDLAREALIAEDPKVVYLLTEQNTTSFATSLPPEQASAALRAMADRVDQFAALPT